MNEVTKAETRTMAIEFAASIFALLSIVQDGATDEERDRVVAKAYDTVRKYDPAALARATG